MPAAYGAAAQSQTARKAAAFQHWDAANQGFERPAGAEQEAGGGRATAGAAAVMRRQSLSDHSFLAGYDVAPSTTCLDWHMTFFIDWHQK
jgi:hypothetical protein